MDSGGTLAANGLVEVEEVCAISSRLIVNKASMKMKHARLKAFIDGLAEAVTIAAARGAGRIRTP